MRRLALVLLAVAAAAAILRRRRPDRYVEVEFEDASAVRLDRGPETRDLLDDAEAILAAR